jgi:hypothetical protein
MESGIAFYLIEAIDKLSVPVSSEDFEGFRFASYHGGRVGLAIGCDKFEDCCLPAVENFSVRASLGSVVVLRASVRGSD